MLDGVEELGEFVAIGDVDGSDENLGALFVGCVDKGGSFVVAAATGDQDEIFGAAIEKELGEREAEAASAASDEISAAGRNVRSSGGLAQNNFAEVMRLGHVAISGDGVAEGEGFGRKGVEFAGFDEFHGVAEKRADEFGLIDGKRREVDNVIGDIAAERGDLLGRPEIALAEFDEAAVGRDDGKSGGDEIAGEGVENDVDAAAFGDARGFRGRSRECGN